MCKVTKKFITCKENLKKIKFPPKKSPHINKHPAPEVFQKNVKTAIHDVTNKALCASLNADQNVLDRAS